ncbi:MAG: UvrD-helicase domain-containing protein [Oligosphaeraceae bacterium]|nr:UvrD-helicase domain-containing protein [Oligosphaeraceae bacterium]
MSAFDDARLLEGLTDSQLEAVTHRDGPMLVIAGAGSGKTRVVTRRLAWLLRQGVWPEQILAMTFTNKAAREMRQRVHELSGKEPRNLGTFHGCCARFLRFDIEKADFGRDRDYTIYDDTEQLAVLKSCIQDLGPGLYNINPKQAAQLISESKNQLLDYTQILGRQPYCPHPELLLQICRNYEEKMRQLNALDFDDLLYLTLKLLQDNPTLLELYQHRLRYLLVDEYQDTNYLQYKLIRLIGGQRANIHVTGDPDQSIYSWRGANYHNIMDFVRDYPEAKVLKLEQNYRSTQNILEVANSLISHNQVRIEKVLFTENETGAPVECHQVADGKAEAQWVLRKARQLQAQGHTLRDMAVLYRTNNQAREIEEAFVHANLPYQIMGGLRFYDRKEIKDFIAFMRLKANPKDELALKRVLTCMKTGIGAKTLQELLNKAAQEQASILHFMAQGLPELPCCAGKGKRASQLREFAQWCQNLIELDDPSLCGLVGSIFKHSGLQEFITQQYDEIQANERLENLDSLLSRVHAFTRENPEAGLADFLQDLSLVSDVDKHDPEADSVVLMTLHSSKGLEFPFIIIVGVEEGLLPHANSVSDAETLEEERRLLYVGITRAKKAVYLLYCRSRYMFGKWDNYRQPSSFLKELPNRKKCYLATMQQLESSYDKYSPSWRMPATESQQDHNDLDLPTIIED